MKPHIHAGYKIRGIPTIEDPHSLQRFVAAQDGVIEQALSELRAGHKMSHWMWFVFPQLRGLGASQTALFYGLASIDEARAYLAHPVLGHRLRRAAQAALSARGRNLREIFGSPDDMKFRSSMTLFERAANGADPVFADAIAALCDGERDGRTLAMLDRG